MSKPPKEKPRRNVIYLSEEIRNGDDWTPVKELLWVTEPDDPDPGHETDRDWRPPDRATNPYGWEKFYRWMMRRDPANLRWRATSSDDRVIWMCQWCGREIEMRSTGRLPRFCSSKCRQAAYRGRVTKRPQ